MSGNNTHYNNNNITNENSKLFNTQERENFHLSLDNIKARDLL